MANIQETYLSESIPILNNQDKQADLMLNRFAAQQSRKVQQINTLKYSKKLNEIARQG